MKKIFGFLALAFLSVYAFAQDCVQTDIDLTGTASVTFSRYEHKVLTGVFSVAEDKHVLFSQGNLQYQASSNTWRFAEEQYERLGVSGYTHNGTTYQSGNSYAGDRSTQSNWIDLFGWGTSGYTDAVASEPYSVSETNADYFGYNLFTSGFSEGQDNADWAYNPIINGGQSSAGPVEHIWRTLTSTEWKYLFSGRINAANLYGMGVLKDVKGVFLLPDTWDWSDVETEMAAYGGFSFTVGASAYVNIIDNSSEGSALWTAMEEKGAVFLPVTGMRGGTQLSFVNDRGYYWSSTIHTPNEYGFFLYIASNSIGTANYQGGNCRGYAVRPVRDL